MFLAKMPLVLRACRRGLIPISKCRRQRMLRESQFKVRRLRGSKSYNPGRIYFGEATTTLTETSKLGAFSDQNRFFTKEVTPGAVYNVKACTNVRVAKNHWDRLVEKKINKAFKDDTPIPEFEYKDVCATVSIAAVPNVLYVVTYRITNDLFEGSQTPIFDAPQIIRF
jgi:hypothetical protein